MIIYTTPEQDALLSNWYRAHVRAHAEAECEPPGYILEVPLGNLAHYECPAIAVCGLSRLDIGEVRVES